MNEQKKDVIDLTEVWKLLKTKKKVFFIVLPIVFVLSCLYIFPQPRYYRCSVKLAPEATSENVAGGLSSLASQFGVNLGGATQDAIYPLLYPDVVSSNEFAIGLLGINVKSVDGLVNTDYYNYMSKLQKKNPIMAPVKKMMRSVTKLFASKDLPGPPSKGTGMSAFRMSKKDSELLDQIKANISCDVDKKTEVITIKVEDQIRLSVPLWLTRCAIICRPSSPSIAPIRHAWTWSITRSSPSSRSVSMSIAFVNTAPTAMPTRT